MNKKAWMELIMLLYRIFCVTLAGDATTFLWKSGFFVVQDLIRQIHAGFRGS
ncbi:hypothetical protein M5W68_11330 [Paenibacillus larvae]|uniref:hypothetical protein n=1 Tax=Paenibacillus larvae TaxID=1464 RepID=UPI002280592F|nr:hypothetical protein [Paenibacillus larvae]MCY9509767.1 hypothetical protein [Paenibacillus larvae]MCY9525702.1 hypothetical protein [Paenibacillus larvae]